MVIIMMITVVIVVFFVIIKNEVGIVKLFIYSCLFFCFFLKEFKCVCGSLGNIFIF